MCHALGGTPRILTRAGHGICLETRKTPSCRVQAVMKVPSAWPSRLALEVLSGYLPANQTPASGVNVSLGNTICLSLRGLL